VHPQVRSAADSARADASHGHAIASSAITCADDAAAVAVSAAAIWAPAALTDTDTTACNVAPRLLTCIKMSATHGAASSVVSMFASSCFANELRVRRADVVVLHAAIEGLSVLTPLAGAAFELMSLKRRSMSFRRQGRGTTVPCRARAECLVIETRSTHRMRDLEQILRSTFSDEFLCVHSRYSP
jgi:hypothetical protein